MNFLANLNKPQVIFLSKIVFKGYIDVYTSLKLIKFNVYSVLVWAINPQKRRTSLGRYSVYPRKHKLFIQVTTITSTA